LHVFAKEKNTGLEKSIVIDNAISRFEGAKLETAKDRINEIFGEQSIEGIIIDQETDDHHTIVQARALVEKAERMLENASPEDREDMVNMIESINDAITKESLADLKEPIEQLSDILYYLES